jgi:hypothetical protein
MIPMHALVAEAMKKAAIIWVSTARDQPAYPLWCFPIDDALYVVTGGDEQPAPGLTSVNEVTVGARGDHGGRIVRWRAAIEPVAPGGEAWETVAPALAGKRLNASGTVDALVATWVDHATVLRLLPIGDEIEPTSDLSAAAPPRPTPAARRTAKPFRLHKVKRRPAPPA